MSKLFSEDTLSHYGIPGQKKGIRRWQYPDGRFNEEGKIRYFGLNNEQRAKYNQELNDYNLEKRYKEMQNEINHPIKTKIKKNIKSLMKNTIIDSIILSASLYAGSKLLKKYGINISIPSSAKEIISNSKNLRDWVNIIPK